MLTADNVLDVAVDLEVELPVAGSEAPELNSADDCGITAEEGGCAADDDELMAEEGGCEADDDELMAEDCGVTADDAKLVDETTSDAEDDAADTVDEVAGIVLVGALVTTLAGSGVDDGLLDAFGEELADEGVVDVLESAGAVAGVACAPCFAQ